MSRNSGRTYHWCDKHEMVVTEIGNRGWYDFDRANDDQPDLGPLEARPCGCLVSERNIEVRSGKPPTP